MVQKILPYNEINAELLYPVCKENAETTNKVLMMASEVAEVMVKELLYPKKATSNYLTSGKVKFCWRRRTDEEHFAFLGKMATNDPAENPFASLTHQLQASGCKLGIHASAIGYACVNGDFAHAIEGTSTNAVHIISFQTECRSPSCSLLSM